MIASYRDLKVWQMGMNLAECSYQLSASMPAGEKFGLVSQIRRASVSVPANIAEGYGRESRGAYVLFLKTARGSLHELETLLLVAIRVGILEQGRCETAFSVADQLGRMLTALIRSLQKRKGDSRLTFAAVPVDP